MDGQQLLKKFNCHQNRAAHYPNFGLLTPEVHGEI